MKKGMLLTALLAMIVTLTPMAHAGDVWEMAESDKYGTKLGGMLGRGLINAASCFVDIFVQTVEKTQTGPPVVGTIEGIAVGATCTVLRAGSGVLDIAGSWVPGFNGIPVSRSYSDCLDVDSDSFGKSSAASSYAAAPSYAAPSTSAKMPAASKPAAATQDKMEYIKK